MKIKPTLIASPHKPMSLAIKITRIMFSIERMFWGKFRRKAIQETVTNCDQNGKQQTHLIILHDRIRSSLSVWRRSSSIFRAPLHNASLLYNFPICLCLFCIIRCSREIFLFFARREWRFPSCLLGARTQRMPHLKMRFMFSHVIAMENTRRQKVIVFQTNCSLFNFIGISSGVFFRRSQTQTRVMKWIPSVFFLHPSEVFN